MIDNREVAAAVAKPATLANTPQSTMPAKPQPKPPAPSSHTKAVTNQILARSEREAREAVFPDLRNIGILARALVLYVAMVATYALASTARPIDLVLNISITLAESLPVAATVAAVWALASPLLRRLAYWQAAVLLVLLTAIVALVAARWMDTVAWRSVPLALIALTAVLVYFHTLGRALSPAVTEARLQALQARIRPHFLFNSINGVLGVLRSEPKRAESALMDMAELFRVLMRENRDLQPLADEITLTRQYLDLEKLRLGDRLNVVWKLDKMPSGALVPPLVLQPIAENAVYHGIEPIQAPGEIEIEVTRTRSEVFITVRNPFLEQPGSHHGGNKMAMQNIRERLALHFDAEARMTSGPRDGRYQVQLVLPYRPATGAPADRKSIV
jgi:two-component system, LytTR family, sensor histidine kinase AlgZ